MDRVHRTQRGCGCVEASGVDADEDIKVGLGQRSGNRGGADVLDLGGGSCCASRRRYSANATATTSRSSDSGRTRIGPIARGSCVRATATSACLAQVAAPPPRLVRPRRSARIRPAPTGSSARRGAGARRHWASTSLANAARDRAESARAEHSRPGPPGCARYPLTGCMPIDARVSRARADGAGPAGRGRGGPAARTSLEPAARRSWSTRARWPGGTAIDRAWVYAHADELGALRLGTGSRPRLRFDPAIVREALDASGRPRQHSRPSQSPAQRPAPTSSCCLLDRNEE